MRAYFTSKITDISPGIVVCGGVLSEYKLPSVILEPYVVNYW